MGTATQQASDNWIELYRRRGALWLHDDNPKRPHALLTSGKHSNGFFNSELVMEDPMLLDKASRALLDLLLHEPEFNEPEFNAYQIDRVVGPAMGAITLAHDLSRHIGLHRSVYCLRGYTEKETVGEDKTMVFKRVSIRPGEKILAVEDVLTTGSSVELTTEAISRAGGIALPFVAVLVNRFGLSEVGGKKIVALIARPMPMWAPEECPLCQVGSEAIRPKGKENWERLNAKY